MDNALLFFLAGITTGLYEQGGRRKGEGGRRKDEGERQKDEGCVETEGVLV